MNLTSLQEPKSMSWLQPWGVRPGVPDLQAKLIAQQSAMGLSVVAIRSWESFPMHDLMKDLLLTQSLKPQAATIQIETPASPTRQAMTPEMEWLTSHAAELSVYRGEWLLILGQKLVAHNTNIREIQKAIQAHDISVPFVYYVPEPEEANFVF